MDPITISTYLAWGLGLTLVFFGIRAIVNSLNSYRLLTYTDRALNVYMKSNGITIMNYSSGSITDTPSQGLGPTELLLIGSEYKKGYDFVSITLPKGYETPIHHHTRSNEFFYVLEGKTKIIAFGGHPEEEEKILSAGECFYVEHKRVHLVEALEETRLIVIAKPPLFKKLPLWTGKVFKAFKR